MLNTRSRFAVVGLGQVGLPLAHALAQQHVTIGIDLDRELLGRVRMSAAAPQLMRLNDDFTALAGSDFIFVTVPSSTEGSLNFADSPLASSCQAISRHLRSGTTLVFESTVYPGTTEELCIPVIERASGLKWKQDFFVAYSPERINPGDREHILQTIPKIVAADSPETLERVAQIYESIIPAGVHRMSSIRAAELTKLLENVQRDVNIALMNELSRVAHGLGVDTREVLDAAGTKWNFVQFRPGLVGGSCLGLASHLWDHTRSELDVPSQLVAQTRVTNEGMMDFVVAEISRALRERGLGLKDVRVAFLGVAFKPDVSITTDSKNLRLAEKLASSGARLWVHDPHVDFSSWPEVPFAVGSTCAEMLAQCDVLVLAVGHEQFKSQPLSQLCAPLRAGGMIVDLTHSVDQGQALQLGFALWRL